MRIIAMAGVVGALLTLPAYAQQQPGMPPYMSLPSMKEDKPPPEAHPGVKADDKAYKSALDGIQAPKQGYDPWRNVRTPQQSNNSR